MATALDRRPERALESGSRFLDTDTGGRQNARIEHDKALTRVMTAVLNDDTELFRQFMDNEGFRRCLTDTVFGLTYEASRSGGLASR